MFACVLNFGPSIDHDELSLHLLWVLRVIECAFGRALVQTSAAWMHAFGPAGCVPSAWGVGASSLLCVRACPKAQGVRHCYVYYDGTSALLVRASCKNGTRGNFRHLLRAVTLWVVTTLAFRQDVRRPCTALASSQESSKRTGGAGMEHLHVGVDGTGVPRAIGTTLSTPVRAVRRKPFRPV